jgi:AGZA family xanthine/uracil permease-like MFS transporter
MTTTTTLTRTAPRIFTPGDVDGFLGLFFSGLPDLLLIAGLGMVCGLPQSLMVGRILPGIAISILLGNLFYSWQAYGLAKRTGRTDVTAIPFGVNAPTIFAYIFLIMEPAYLRTHDATVTWQVGVFACLLSGVVQTAGAFCTDWLRRSTPRAALLCPLAGIALAFLCLGFIFGVFQTPAIGILPLVILFALYASHLRLPFRIPAPALAMAVGAALVVILQHFHLYTPPATPAAAPGLYLPHPINVFAFLRHSDGWRFLSVILPMSLLDTIVSLQILESVAIAGDDYPTVPSLLVNGLATLAAALFGSPFPTTLYFGHMAHKANGARIGYSAISGVTTFLLCVTGILPLVLRVIPIEVAAAVIIWFGLVMMGQAFSEVSANHAIAVALGLIPLLAQWALGLVELALRVAGSTMLAAAPRFGGDLAIYGLIALSQGSLLISMVWAASLAYMFDRRFLAASAWMAAAAVLSAFGLIHAFTITPEGVESAIGLWKAPAFALSYAAGAGFLVVCHWYSAACGPQPATPGQRATAQIEAGARRVAEH